MNMHQGCSQHKIWRETCSDCWCPSGSRMNSNEQKQRHQAQRDKLIELATAWSDAQFEVGKATAYLDESEHQPIAKRQTGLITELLENDEKERDAAKAFRDYVEHMQDAAHISPRMQKMLESGRIEANAQLLVNDARDATIEKISADIYGINQHDEIKELKRIAAAFERWGQWLYGVEWQNIKLKWLDSVPEAYK